MLSESQIAKYRCEGMLVLQGLVSAEVLERIDQEVSFLSRSSIQLAHQTDNIEFEDGDASGQRVIRRFNSPHEWMGSVSEFCRSQLIVEILKPLLGPGIRLHGSKINLKPPSGAPIEWHQDWAFYPHTNDDFLSVGLMLDDTGVENGAMMCVPGSHTGPIYDHRNPQSGYFVHSIDLDAHKVDLTGAVPLCGPKGSITLHHGRTLHGSAPNRSDRSRRFLLATYAAADAWPLTGVGNYADFERSLIAGSSTTFPRMKELPITVPYPLSQRGDHIFESQKSARQSFFTSTENQS